MEGVGVKPDFWHGRKVFLTGHTGFKGSWLSLWLKRLGAEVTGYALPPSTVPSLFVLAGVEKDMHSVMADVRDAKKLEWELSSSGAEIVIHMAAQPLVRHSYADPVQTYATNVMGTVHLCEAVRRSPKVRAVLNVTSDKCYENKERADGYREGEPLGGNDPYSSSKACSELICAAYRYSYFSKTSSGSGQVALATVRAGNVIGGGDWAPDRLVPDVLAAFEAGHPARIRNPGASRPWQHVLEALGAYLSLCERLCEQGDEFAQAWNIGPRESDAWPVGQLVDRLAQMWGGSAKWECDKTPHPHEAKRLQLDTAKARNRLGWRPLLDVESSLVWTVEWEKARLAGADMREYTHQQIDLYQSLILKSQA